MPEAHHASIANLSASFLHEHKAFIPSPPKWELFHAPAQALTPEVPIGARSLNFIIVSKTVDSSFRINRIRFEVLPEARIVQWKENILNWNFRRCNPANTNWARKQKNARFLVPRNWNARKRMHANESHVRLAPPFSALGTIYGNKALKNLFWKKLNWRQSKAQKIIDPL